ncbi:MAG: protein-L-isoaspartate(D-aspartate) O-methyltransferase [Bacteroidota bacterium]
MVRLEDTYKHRGMRKMLVRELKEKGIKDNDVLEAIGRVPRHYFFDPIFDQHAYEDKAFPIGEGQTISQPYTVAFQSELLEVKPGSKILEIGTGSGYQACILAELGAEVYTIEYIQKLHKQSKKRLTKMGYHLHFYHGDGSKGLPEEAPYDGIIVTAGAPSIPNELIKQLKIGGKLIIPVGEGKTQTMIRLIKTSDTTVSRKEFNQFSFVPLRGEKGIH